VAEEQTIEQILAAMPPNQRRKFLSNATFLNNSRMLNQNQQAIAGIQAPPKPYNFEKPEGVGGTLKNIGKNLFRPVLERAGLAPSIEGRLANMQYNKFLRESYLSSNELVRENMGRNYLASNITETDEELVKKKLQQIGALSGDALRDTVKNVVGVRQTGRLGGTYQVNSLTGQEVNQQNLPTELQQYFLDNPSALRQLQPQIQQAELNNAQSDLVNKVPSFSDFTIGNESQKTSYKLAAENTAKIGNTYDEQATTAYTQQNTLQEMYRLLNETDLKTGGGQELLTNIQSLGYNLGINSESPQFEEVFAALSNQIIIPLVKQLGVNPTDKDFAIIQQASAGLRQTKEGNQILLQARIIGANRAIMIQDAFQKFSSDNLNIKARNPLEFESKWKILLSEMKKSPDWQGDLLAQLNRDTRSITGNEAGVSMNNLVQEQFSGEELK